MVGSPFDKLKSVLQSTRTWLDNELKDPRAIAEVGDLLLLLREYVDHCERTPSKWTRRAKALEAIEKIDEFSAEILAIRYKSRLRRRPPPVK